MNESLKAKQGYFDQVQRFFIFLQLKPVIQEVFSYSDMPAAYEAIESGSARGKIVVNYGLSE